MSDKPKSPMQKSQTLEVKKADLNAVINFLDSSMSKKSIKNFIIKYILKNERI